MLRSVYPDHAWQPWLFKKAAQKYWSDPANRRAFLDHALATLPYGKTLDSMYKLKKKDIKDLGGIGLFRKYRFSMHDMLQSVYPEHEWLPWKFAEIPHLYWKDVKHQKRFLEWAFKELSLKEMSDWYGVTAGTLAGLGGAF
jgi:hypothetical protein